MTSPVERISGPSTVSTPGKAAEGQHRFLHADVVGHRRRRRARCRARAARERVAHHHPHRHLGERHAGRLGDEGDRATGAGIRLEHEDLVVLHRVLHVDQAHDAEGFGDLAGCGSQASSSTVALSDWGGSAQAESPECTPASSTCSMMPAMKMSPVVAHRIDVDLDRVFEEAVEQDGPALARRPLLGPAIRANS